MLAMICEKYVLRAFLWFVRLLSLMMPDLTFFTLSNPCKFQIYAYLNRLHVNFPQ